MAQRNLNSAVPSVEPLSGDEKMWELSVVHNDPPHQKTDNSDNEPDVGSKKLEEKKNNESESEDEHEDEKSKPKPEPKNIVTEDTGRSSTEETERLREALKKIKEKQATHALYCPKCTLDITENVKLYKKTEAPYPFDQKTWVLWVPFVFRFSFNWRWCISVFQEPGKPTPSPSETPNLPEVIGGSLPPSDDNTRGWIISLLLKINLLYLLVVVVVLVLPLLLVIVFWALPSSKGGGHKKPVLPSLPSLPLPMHFSVIKYLPVILLFLLAVLILAWRHKKGSMPSPTVLTDVLRDFIVAPFQLSSVKIDILKSIVYGGLIESITSLGVVSSAAGSGASTLNVLALGLANLFSGLFLIIHNFCVLRWRSPYTGETHDHMSNLGEGDEAKGDEAKGDEAKGNEAKVDKAKHPYEIMLGEKKMAWLHGFVVLVSLVIFAVIPPLLYGFSYKIIEGEHSKATVVFFVSLVCVICLSFAKAHAFSMNNKLMIVAEYTGIAIVASVVSFLAGHYFMDAFGKFDLH